MNSVCLYDRILAYFFFLFSQCSNAASERPDWGSCDEPENLIFIRSRSCRSLSHLRAVCPNVCGADCDPFVAGDWKQCHLSFWGWTYSGSYSRKTGFGVSGIIHFCFSDDGAWTDAWRISDDHWRLVSYLFSESAVYFDQFLSWSIVVSEGAEKEKAAHRRNCANTRFARDASFYRLHCSPAFIFIITG